MKRRTFGCVLFLGMLFVACIRVPTSASYSSSRMETHCIGRFLIDLPAGAQVRGSYISQGSQVQTLRGVSAEAFADTVAARQDEWQTTVHATGGPMLVERDEIAQNHVTLVSWASQAGKRVYRYEEYQYIPEEQVLFIFNGLGNATAEARKQAALTQRKYAQYTRHRNWLEIPTTPGFCICNGFIEGSALNKEEMDVAFSFPAHPQLTLHVSAFVTAYGMNPTPPRKGLAAFLPGLKVLRKRTRKWGGAQATEYVWKYRERGQWFYEFTLNVPSEGNSLSRPYMRIDLNENDNSSADGEERNARPSFGSDEQALQFWDAVLAGFRLRPGGV